MPRGGTPPLLTDSGLPLLQLPFGSPGNHLGAALPTSKDRIVLPVKPTGRPTLGENDQHTLPRRNAFLLPGTRPQTMQSTPSLGSSPLNTKGGGVPLPVTHSEPPFAKSPYNPPGSLVRPTLPPFRPKLSLPPKPPVHPKAGSAGRSPLTLTNPFISAKNTPQTFSPVQPVVSSLGAKLPLPPKSPVYPKAGSGGQPPLTITNPPSPLKNASQTLSPVEPVGSSSLFSSSMPTVTPK